MTRVSQDLYPAYTQRRRSSHDEAPQEKLRSCADGEVASRGKPGAQEKATRGGDWMRFHQAQPALSSMGHFKKLKAWEHARALVLVSKPLIARLPSDEKSGLASQWRRAATSVVLNIAEGASRPGPKEFRRRKTTWPAFR